jgi:hypothetical protein
MFIIPAGFHVYKRHLEESRQLLKFFVLHISAANQALLLLSFQAKLGKR